MGEIPKSSDKQDQTNLPSYATTVTTWILPSYPFVIPLFASNVGRLPKPVPLVLLFLRRYPSLNDIVIGSEQMSLVQLFVPTEVAHDTVAELGELGNVQFKDVRSIISCSYFHHD